MDYTHDFRFQCADHMIDGQINLTQEGPLAISYTNPLEETIQKSQALDHIFSAINEYYQTTTCHDILLIRFKKK